MIDKIHVWAGRLLDSMILSILCAIVIVFRQTITEIEYVYIAEDSENDRWVECQ